MKQIIRRTLTTLGCITIFLAGATSSLSKSSLIFSIWAFELAYVIIWIVRDSELKKPSIKS